jgi:polyferredoxin
MRIITARRISQVFFCLLFIWFCCVATLGTQWWQLRGWPINWFLELDPLVGLATVLSTGVLYSGLLWGVLTLVLTVFLGRFFCGWVCPFGTLQQVFGYWGQKPLPMKAKIDRNRYHPWQSLKYYLLIFLLTSAALEMLARGLSFYGSYPIALFIVLGILGIASVGLARRQQRFSPWSTAKYVALAIIAWGVLRWVFRAPWLLPASLQTGLLDPLPLAYRSINLTLIPLMETLSGQSLSLPRFYTGTALIGVIFFGSLFLCVKVPRFYCRFICPLGALFGALAPFAVWRIRKGAPDCKRCHGCEAHCEGACSPSAQLRSAECVLCFNCRDACPSGRIQFGSDPSITDDLLVPDLSKRTFLFSFATGVCTIPIVRLQALTGTNWNPALIRPPGALPEKQFLNRCLKCGQCMRICPTNVIQPAGVDQGIEALWSPLLNFRIGTSGCQLNCVACGHVCPTAAIRPLHIDERLGRNQFEMRGALSVGTAFVDRGRCLPWAMDKPCIVCQENCPVSPKAIETRVSFIRQKPPDHWTITHSRGVTIDLAPTDPIPYIWASGDYYCRVEGGPDVAFGRIVQTGSHTLKLAEPLPWRASPEPGTKLGIYVRLQRPFVDPHRCIGCGVCEHECPVLGLRAIRVSAEGETRHPQHRMVLTESR